MIDTIAKISIALLLVAALASCRHSVVRSDNKSLPESVWNQDTILTFQFDIEDTVSVFDFYLNLRHTTEYRYSNIYFFVETVFPAGQQSIDTIEFILADRTGEWYGKGFGKIKDFRVLLREAIRFPYVGEYKFRFEQAMREENLTGIKDIGISLEKH